MMKNKVLNLNAESYKHFGKTMYAWRKISPSVFINKTASLRKPKVSLLFGQVSLLFGQVSLLLG